MSTTADIILGPFDLGNVDRLRVTVLKDGVAWNLSAGSVALTFKKPDRATTLGPYTMTAENAAGGIFYYDTLTTDFDTAGWWTLGVKVTDGSVVKKYPRAIGFRVNDEPY